TVEEQTFSVMKQGHTDKTHGITISIGVACFPADSDDPIELVEMADSALYRAKREGRNKVCAYQDLSPEEINKPLPPRKD
ncbi:MAG: diguanylate cyclase, partial [Blastocatellia bacterium]|nr:diguanylate cyclase [Blastocatellia bacterium]